MQQEAEFFKPSVTDLKDLANYTKDAHRLRALRDVAGLFRSALERHSKAVASDRLPGFSYEFPSEALDFVVIFGAWRLYVRFSVCTHASEAAPGERTFYGRYVYELPAVDQNKVVGIPCFAVSFDDDGSVRLGDFLVRNKYDLRLSADPLDRDMQSLREIFVKAEMSLLDAVYDVSPRRPAAQV